MCRCVPGEVLRQCSAANPADIIIRAVHDSSILYFMPITLSDQIQVDFCFLGLLARHSDFPGYERDVTRISLRIALRTLDLQIHALNSLPSGPRA